MQVEYKKEWMDTYLWVLPDKPCPKSFEEQMINHNSSGGWVEFIHQEKDGEEYLCYKVTGKKALNSIYAAIPMGERQIRLILGQLFHVLEEGKEYLLSEDNFVLSPNYIFATLPQMRLEFCYLPGYDVSLKEQLEGLFEYLLNRVDYEDKQGVNLLYDCYMYCMREKGGLAEIRKRLDGNEEKVKSNTALPETVNTELLKPAPETKPAVYEKQEEEERSREPATSYVSWLSQKLFPWKRREPVMVTEKEERYTPVDTKQGCEEAYERTVLLSSVAKPSGPELVCGQTGETVSLLKFPFYIGSAKEFADYVLSTEGVSRIHCCISRRENNYYLSDLNSTNGTYLNGKEVLPGNEILLSANDEIRVCSREFYMKFPCH